MTTQDQLGSMSDQRRLTPVSRRGALPAAAAAVLVTLAVCACGGSQARSHSATILNTVKVQQAIERSAMTQRSEHATVICPAGVPQTRGITFDCIATVGQTSTRFLVTELDGAGDVHYAAR